jgi:hypothetical protein
MLTGLGREIAIVDRGERWLRKADEEIFRGSKQSICVRQQNNNLRIDVRGTSRQVLI